ncbi:hypothetical protein CKA32_007027 [Geitlerinema sp. FC II]|nr:hypothetical protein CKA32_007027 [Geitlerinema sp. FC II]
MDTEMLGFVNPMLSFLSFTSLAVSFMLERRGFYRVQTLCLEPI